MRRRAGVANAANEPQSKRSTMRRSGPCQFLDVAAGAGLMFGALWMTGSLEQKHSPCPKLRGHCPPCAPRRVATRWAGQRVWNTTVKCAFVTLLQEAASDERYAGFVESTTRLRRAFKLEREYPHIAFHEAGFPEAHQAAIKAAAPWTRFVDVSDVWGNDVDRPAVELWNATDRSEGYKNMCRFYGLQIFDVSRRLGIHVIMRVDDDVFMLRGAPYDPFRVLWESGDDYGWGAVTRENHLHTEFTFAPWVADFSGDKEIADGIIDRMFFNNVFATVLDYWTQESVIDFFRAVDKSHGIYVHRWGDAPIQTAAVRLFGGRARQLPQLHYAHFSTDNLIVDGSVSCLSCDGALTYFSQLTSDSSPRKQGGNHERAVVTIDEIIHAAIPHHKSTFVDDIQKAGIWRDWGLGTTLDDLPIFAFLQIIEKIGVLCDNVGLINFHILLPLTCCCHLDTQRDDPTAQLALTGLLYKSLEPWMTTNLVKAFRAGSTDWLMNIQQNADSKASARDLPTPTLPWQQHGAGHHPGPKLPR